AVCPVAHPCEVSGLQIADAEGEEELSLVVFLIEFVADKEERRHHVTGLFFIIEFHHFLAQDERQPFTGLDQLRRDGKTEEKAVQLCQGEHIIRIDSFREKLCEILLFVRREQSRFHHFHHIFTLTLIVVEENRLHRKTFSALSTSSC